MSSQNVQLPYLPTDTIVPSPVNLIDFMQYLTRLYEEIAINVNSRDFIFFPIEISDTPVDIPNLPRFGSFLLLVSGVQKDPPTGIWALNKSSPNVSGVVTPLSSQIGVMDWTGNVLTVTPTATNFQIEHDRPDFPAGFNIRIIGTQL